MPDRHLIPHDQHRVLSFTSVKMMVADGLLVTSGSNLLTRVSDTPYLSSSPLLRHSCGELLGRYLTLLGVTRLIRCVPGLSASNSDTSG